MCRDGLYMGVKKVQYVVIAGYDTLYQIDWKYNESGKRPCYENNFTQCLGVYDNVNEAYGRAYLYLESIAHDYGEGYMISQMGNTEDTGCRFVIVPPPEKRNDQLILDWVWVLFNTLEVEEDGKENR